MTTVFFGTRSSRLAQAQTDMALAAVRARFPDLALDRTTIQTSGDWLPVHGETPLSEAQGGKGLFVKEIEQALLDRRIDVGVHSLKDVPTFDTDHLMLAAFLPREDVRDVLISRSGASFDRLPKGSVIGTASVRRQEQVRALRPDLTCVPLRGNVTTRLDKLMQGQMDAIILAAAGLHRMGLSHAITEYLDTERFLPACGQGIIALQIRTEDQVMQSRLSDVTCPRTTLQALAERTVLTVLDGSCRTPIGAYAAWDANDALTIQACVVGSDGGWIMGKRVSRKPGAHEITALATALGHELKDAQAPAKVMA